MTDDIDDQPSLRRARKERHRDEQLTPLLQQRRRPPPAVTADTPSPSSRLSSGSSASDGRDYRESNAEEKVGYGHPPKRSRFQPGRSGNPRGRPKNARSLKAHVLKVLDETVEVTEQGRNRKMTKREVIARRMVQQAMAGNLKPLAVITAFDPVEDELPAKDDPLTEHEKEMLAHYLGITDEEEKAK